MKTAFLLIQFSLLAVSYAASINYNPQHPDALAGTFLGLRNKLEDDLDDFADNDENAMGGGNKEKRCHPDEIVGSLNKLILRRRDLEKEMVRRSCDNCRETFCRMGGKCEMCQKACEKVEPINLQSRFNDDVPLDNNRYYTLGSFGPGTMQKLIFRLLNMKNEDKIARIIILADVKAKGQKDDELLKPLVIDTASVFVEDGKSVPLEMELHGVKNGGNKKEKNASKIISIINKELDDAVIQKTKLAGISQLTPEEIEAAINRAMSSINGGNPDANAKIVGTEQFPRGNPLPVQPSQQMVAVPHNENTPQSGAFGNARTEQIPTATGVNDNSNDTVACSKEKDDDDDYYREANGKDENPMHTINGSPQPLPPPISDNHRLMAVEPAQASGTSQDDSPLALLKDVTAVDELELPDSAAQNPTLITQKDVVPKRVAEQLDEDERLGQAQDNYVDQYKKLKDILAQNIALLPKDQQDNLRNLIQDDVVAASSPNVGQEDPSPMNVMLQSSNTPPIATRMTPEQMRQIEEGVQNKAQQQMTGEEMLAKKAHHYKKHPKKHGKKHFVSSPQDVVASEHRPAFVDPKLVDMKSIMKSVGQLPQVVDNAANTRQLEHIADQREGEVDVQNRAAEEIDADAEEVACSKEKSEELHTIMIQPPYRPKPNYYKGGGGGGGDNSYERSLHEANYKSSQWPILGQRAPTEEDGGNKKMIARPVAAAIPSRPQQASAQQTVQQRNLPESADPRIPPVVNPENVGARMDWQPEEEVSDSGPHHVGKFVPDTSSTSVTTNKDPMTPNKMIFLGDGVRLPVNMKQHHDGSYHVSVDLETLCNCRENHNCTAKQLEAVAAAEKANLPLAELAANPQLLDLTQPGAEEGRSPSATRRIQKRSPQVDLYHSGPPPARELSRAPAGYVDVHFSDEDEDDDVKYKFDNAGDVEPQNNENVAPAAQSKSIPSRVDLLRHMLKWVKNIAESDVNDP